MECVILCGGKAVRMGNLSEDLPKPLFPIDGKTVLELIMQTYVAHGINKFIVCTGHKSNKFEEYFKTKNFPFEVKVIDTGEETNKAGRLIKIKNQISGDFFVSYGDDVANVDVSKLLAFHRKEGKVATLTAVKINNPYGVLKFDEIEPSRIASFIEKPLMNEWINGGYFVFKKEIFDFVNSEDDLETDVFGKLVKANQLVAYRHPGFWKSMNTPKDYAELKEMYAKGVFSK